MKFLLFLLGLCIFGYPFMAASIVNSKLRRRVDALESAMQQLQMQRLQAQAVTAPASKADNEDALPEREDDLGAPTVIAPPVPRPPVPIPRAKPAVRPAQATVPPVQKAAPPPAPPTPSPPPAWVSAARNWLFTGNLVAKLGLLILFIGVSFLLKYAAERVTVPIELRLAGIVLADIGLLAWGWRMRLTRRNLSLPIQGAALAIMMLVTFGAFRLYDLIPANLAFGLLFVLTVFTCLLAVMQDALWLAVFGIAGGFVSPILTSTGQGSHVALFSYYALLNAGILGIALKRTWRSLNLLGFAFTFIIGTTWGVLRYDAGSDYLTTQAFLILFFLFYVAIAIIYASRQQQSDKPYVDATIVFGTALAAFSLQLALVKQFEFGNAFAALGFGVFYTALALAMWRRRGAQLKLMIESFLALGVVFGTLAIPFAVDSRWTSAAWALEGAGVVWVGLRQRQRRTYLFGLLVQAGAWIAFIASLAGLVPGTAAQSNVWLGFLLLAATAFFMATTFRAEKEGDREAYPVMSGLFLAGAAAWFMAGAWVEIILRFSESLLINLLAATGLATAALLAGIAIRMRWHLARTLSLLAQLLAGAAVLGLTVMHVQWNISPNPFNGPMVGAVMIFAGALFTAYNAWRRPLEGDTDRLSRAMLAWAAFWWLGPVLIPLAGTIMVNIAAWKGNSMGTMTEHYFLLLPLSAVAFAMAARRLAWDALRWLSIPAWVALAMTTLFTLWELYDAGFYPRAIPWLAFGTSWLASEWLLRAWPAKGWTLAPWALKTVHTVRTAGPWIMLWKVGEIAIDRWLAGPATDHALLAESGVTFSASWSGFVPFWALMLALAWLTRRSSSSKDDAGERWPVAPLASWYRRCLIPVAVGWSVLLTFVWNLMQDGSMAPLPYVPLLNPLDLSTAFALLAAVTGYRMLKDDAAALGPSWQQWWGRAPAALAVAAYGWFNLIVLRSAAQWLDLPYHVDALFGSLFVQAMMSLVWSISALVLMRIAVKKPSRALWMIGAALLALVVAKLFLVDLSGTGSVARIVSFVGVGMLMVLIGYLAPYPNGGANAPVPEGA